MFISLFIYTDPDKTGRLRVATTIRIRYVHTGVVTATSTNSRPPVILLVIIKRSIN